MKRGLYRNKPLILFTEVPTACSTLQELTEDFSFLSEVVEIVEGWSDCTGRLAK